MKKTLFKKTNKMYRITLLLIVFVMLVSSIPASAVNVSTGNLKRIELSSGETVTLTKQQLDDIIEVTADEAEKMAKEFIANMIKIGNVCWDENTRIISIVPMYDTDESINAYAVNLSSGYVIVTAYMDASFKIFEWADKGEPIYKSLNASATDKIIYLGGYDYYIDDGDDKLIGLNGETVKSDITVNKVKDVRDIANIPDAFFDEIQSTSTYSTNSYIENTLLDSEKYGDNFVVNSYVDNWSGKIAYYEDSYPLDNAYFGSCGPIAITNAIIAFKNKYPGSGSSVPSNNNNLFREVANYGANKGYYSSYNKQTASGEIIKIGTSMSSMAKYAKEANNMYYIYPSVTDVSGGLGSYNRYLSELQNNNLIIIMPYDENKTDNIVDNAVAIYGDHAMLCHGFIRYYSQTESAYLSYVHLADGINNSIRYLPMAWVLNCWSVVIDY